mmetsp:Transcript_3129/g.9052  ORF Transcript_3129/g.9052 Transcript_3129/m.9052 type:complete len:132 (+) Transcript_3129:793-1188(+)
MSRTALDLVSASPSSTQATSARVDAHRRCEPNLRAPGHATAGAKPDTLEEVHSHTTNLAIHHRAATRRIRMGERQVYRRCTGSQEHPSETLPSALGAQGVTEYSTHAAQRLDTLLGMPKAPDATTDQRSFT